jgi:5'-nucleotidase
VSRVAARAALTVGIHLLRGCAGAPELEEPRVARPDLPDRAPPAPPSPPVHIQILAINDFHGNLEPPSGSSGVVAVPPDDPFLREHPDAGASAEADGSRVLVPAGGAAYLAAHIKLHREKNPNTVVVSAGDLTGASPLISNLFLDEPSILAMNLIGLDFEGVGNHDFDRGLGELERLAHGGCSLGDCDAGSFPGGHFEYLAANVRASNGLVGDGEGATVFPPYGVRDVAGVRLAFIGVTLEDTPSVTAPNGVRGLAFRNEASTINSLLPELKEQRVDKIVVLIHQGAHQQGGGTYDSCQNLSGDLMPFLAALSPEVDIVVSAHTHEAYNCVLDGRIVTSAASFGRLITRIDLTWDPDARRFTDERAENVVVTRDVPPDPEVLRLVATYAAKAKPLTSRVVGYVKGSFVRGNLAAVPRPGERRSCESPAGELIADAQLAATHAAADGGAEVSFMNPGGVRTDLFSRGGSGAQFALTFAEAFEVQPFGNRLVTMTLSGAQIQSLLDMQLELGRLLQVSKGFTYRLVMLQPGARPGVESGSIRIGGKPLDAKRKYRVTVNSFLAGGGDRFSVLREGTDRKEGPLDIEALAAYLSKVSSPAKPLEPAIVGGRIGGDVCK